jgi:hypothetical protein
MQVDAEKISSLCHAGHVNFGKSHQHLRSVDGGGVGLNLPAGQHDRPSMALRAV